MKIKVLSLIFVLITSFMVSIFVSAAPVSAAPIEIFYDGTFALQDWTFGDLTTTNGADYWGQNTAHGGQGSTSLCAWSAQNGNRPTTIIMEDYVNDDLAPGWGTNDLDDTNGKDMWNVSSTRAHTGSYSIWCAQLGAQGMLPNWVSGTYDDYMDARLFSFVGTVGYDYADLSFWYWLDCENNFDFLEIIWVDGYVGGWEVLGDDEGPEYPGVHLTGNSGGWQQVTVSIPLTATGVGFRFYSDESVSDYEGAYLDDIVLTGYEDNTDVGYYDNWMDAVMYREVDLSGYSSAELNYWYWMDDADGSYDYLEVFYREGTSWTYVDRHNSGISDWQESTVIIPTSANRVGFRFHSDGFVCDYEGAYVDTVTLTAEEAQEGLSVEDLRTWFWNSDTYIRCTAWGDVDGDEQEEIVTVGHFWDGGQNAQLVVWDGATLALEDVTTWYWTSHTTIASVAVGDVDGDSDMEIVTGGCYNDGSRNVAQLVVWDGETLAVEDIRTWYWTSHTNINSVAVGDVDGDGDMEIVTGGYFDDGSWYNAQLCVWDGATLAIEDVSTWYWTSETNINSVAVGDVDDDSDMEIVTGGYYHDGTCFNAQLVVWDGATLALEDVTTWCWTDDTRIESVAVGDVDGDSDMEIVTGGEFDDGSQYNAQLCVWDGATLALEDVTTWCWTSNTVINSVAVGDVDGDSDMEIVTGGYYHDGTRYNAQLVVWDGETLAVEDIRTWCWTSYTYINSVAVGDVDGDSDMEIVTGAYYNDGSRYNAQLVVWGVS